MLEKLDYDDWQLSCFFPFLMASSISSVRSQSVKLIRRPNKRKRTDIGEPGFHALSSGNISDSFLAPIQEDAQLWKYEIQWKTSMLFAPPFPVGFHYSENQSGNGAQNFLMPPVARSINLYGRFPLKAFNVDWVTHDFGKEGQLS